MRPALLTGLLLFGFLAVATAVADTSSATDESDFLDNSLASDLAELNENEESADPEAKQWLDSDSDSGWRRGRRRERRRFRIRRLLRRFGSRRSRPFEIEGRRGRAGRRRRGFGRRIVRRLRGLARLLSGLNSTTVGCSGVTERQRRGLIRWSNRMSRFLVGRFAVPTATPTKTPVPAIVPRSLNENNDDAEAEYY